MRFEVRNDMKGYYKLITTAVVENIKHGEFGFEEMKM